MADVVIVNAATGERIERDFTDEERAQRDKDVAEWEKRKAAEEKERAAKEAARESALAKLTALGLTEAEAASIIK
jgi:F0F1-type ATP synthase epsilon subunit